MAFSENLPKPSLIDVDETSLTLGWDKFEIPPALQAKLQYKIPQEPWEAAKEVDILGSEVKITSEIADLDPGTPYCVRVALANRQTGDIEQFGKETVFDTAPINCTPKEKKCIIS